MAGHSKYKNIMYRKGAQDKKRSSAFSKLSREITVAAKMGLPDVDMNPRLRAAVNAAKAASLPKENIQRSIDKASRGDAENYEEIRYEGFGPGGVSLIIEALTDNRNRTATNVRVAVGKNGGNLGAGGSVSHAFDRVGLISYPASAGDADTVFEAALEAGAEDVVADDEGGFEVLCPPNDFAGVKDALDAAGFKAEVAEIIMKPATETVFTGDDAVKMQKLLDALENLDDVQEIYSNALIED